MVRVLKIGQPLPKFGHEQDYITTSFSLIEASDPVFASPCICNQSTNNECNLMKTYIKQVDTRKVHAIKIAAERQRITHVLRRHVVLILA